MNFTETNFTTKDSGKREQFTSGMVRDTQDGKTNFALVFSGPMLERWAALLTRGAVKYERDNWMKASGTPELQRFQESAARHFAQWMRGDTDEDHAAAVVFNLNGAEYVKDRLSGEDDTQAEIIKFFVENEKNALDGVGEDEDLESEPPMVATQNGSLPQGDGDDGSFHGVLIEQINEYARDLRVGCLCWKCALVNEYASTPVQVLNLSEKKVDNAS